jgi:hypothetical protein
MTPQCVLLLLWLSLLLLLRLQVRLSLILPCCALRVLLLWLLLLLQHAQQELSRINVEECVTNVAMLQHPHHLHITHCTAAAAAGAAGVELGGNNRARQPALSTPSRNLYQIAQMPFTSGTGSS